MASSPEIQYQGRKAQRADSRERRRAILEATLRIIVREGIRGVRHRAVAKEADVPLAATTYYFKDIGDLITDAFNLYAEDSLAGTRALEESSFAFLNQFSPEELQATEARSQLADALAQFIIKHITEQIADRDMRVLENTFRNEALRNEKLAINSRIPQQQMLDSIITFFTLLHSSDPEADAHIIMGVILHMEHLALSSPGEQPTELVTRTISRMIRRVLQMPPE